MQASSISCAVTRRGGSASTFTSLRPSTSWPSSTSPTRRSKRPRLSFSPARRTAPGSSVGDPVHRHEQLAPPDPRLQAGHRRVAAIGQPHDQILDAAEPLARAIQQRAAQEVRQMHHRLGQSAHTLRLHADHSDPSRSCCSWRAGPHAALPRCCTCAAPPTESGRHAPSARIPVSASACATRPVGACTDRNDIKPNRSRQGSHSSAAPIAPPRSPSAATWTCGGRVSANRCGCIASAMRLA